MSFCAITTMPLSRINRCAEVSHLYSGNFDSKALPDTFHNFAALQIVFWWNSLLRCYFRGNSMRGFDLKIRLVAWSPSQAAETPEFNELMTGDQLWSKILGVSRKPVQPPIT